MAVTGQRGIVPHYSNEDLSSLYSDKLLPTTDMVLQLQTLGIYMQSASFGNLDSIQICHYRGRCAGRHRHRKHCIRHAQRGNGITVVTVNRQEAQDSHVNLEHRFQSMLCTITTQVVNFYPDVKTSDPLPTS